MTWYTTQVFVEPKQSIISAFCSAGLLSNGLFLIKHLDSYQWPHPESYHNIPVNGLLIVRELCNPNTHAASWHGENAIYWNNSVRYTDTDVIRPIDIFSPDEFDISEESYPQIELLHFLKQVSKATNSTISLYHCAMWAGDIEEDFAWVFSDEDKVYVLKERNSKQIIEYRGSGLNVISRVTPEGNVLQLVLRHHGIELRSRYFAPHTRSFAWEKYKLECNFR